MLCFFELWLFESLELCLFELFGLFGLFGLCLFESFELFWLSLFSCVGLSCASCFVCAWVLCFTALLLLVSTADLGTSVSKSVRRAPRG